ncbi:MAG: hypothetical protein KBG83_06925 [Bacteroidetes bacterium]|nr:hypothetical protein [Bacteroidota bacterium]
MQPSYSYVIGIDGGGTQTTAVICNLQGSVLAIHHGSPTNVNTVGIEQTARTLAQLINQCCVSVRCSIQEIGAVVAGLAGGSEAAVQNRIREVINGFFGEEVPLYIENDARIALESAFGENSGLIVVVGTGSVIYGKRTDGSLVCVGGWGRALGDEGSGWWLGKELLRVALAEYDGIGKRTLCTELLAVQHGFNSRDRIIEAVYRENFDIASLAPVVLQAAMEKDEIARNILKDGCAYLLQYLKYAEKMVRRKNEKTISLVFVGSLLTKKNIYSHMLKSLIRQSEPHLKILKAKYPPAIGAAHIARAILAGRKTLFTEM